MKTVLNQKCRLILLLFLGGLPLITSAQHTAPAKIEPYKIAITYEKTSHLIFPGGIRYVDLGSDNLIAGKAENAENVLRVKAAIKDFKGETNFSVITMDGEFYNFDVSYSVEPGTLNYDLRQMQEDADKEKERVMLEELGFDSPYLATAMLETIYRRDNRVLRHIGSRSSGMRFLVKGIYVRNGKFYLHIEVTNETYVPFVIDFVEFKIIDRKTAKRTVIQERPLQPLRTFKPIGTIGGKSTERNVFLLDQFTIGPDKVLSITLHEKNGGRHQTCRIYHSDLQRAKPTTEFDFDKNRK